MTLYTKLNLIQPRFYLALTISLSVWVDINQDLSFLSRKMNSIYKECLLDAKKHILIGSEKSDTSDGVVSYIQ